MDITQLLAPVATVLGVVSGAGYVVKKVYDLKKEVKSIEQERQKLEQEKDDYEQTVSTVRDVIVDLQGIVKNGTLDEDQLQRCLDALETCVLPEEQQILSKLDRLQTQIDNK